MTSPTTPPGGKGERPTEDELLWHRGWCLLHLNAAPESAHHRIALKLIDSYRRLRADLAVSIATNEQLMGEVSERAAFRLGADHARAAASAELAAMREQLRETTEKLRDLLMVSGGGT